VAGCCECGDERSGSCATELVSYTGGNVIGRERPKFLDKNLFECHLIQNMLNWGQTRTYGVRS
jgi:hypothetical protein